MCLVQLRGCEPALGAHFMIAQICIHLPVLSSDIRKPDMVGPLLLLSET